MVDFGITTDAGAIDNLIAGPVKTFACLLDSAATAAKGQVLEFDTTGKNFVNYTSGSAKPPYVVCAEDVTLTADTRVLCIVSGDVTKTELDATAQADGEIEAALLKSGIRPL